MIIDSVNPKYSVIMTVWNRVGIVEDAIHSVLAQTFTDYELIIVDDGSVDDLKAAVQPLLTERVSFYQEPHRGFSAARNLGLRKARGEYVAYLDSDNRWHPEFLAVMDEAIALSPPGSETFYCQYNVYRRDYGSGAMVFEGVSGRPFDPDRFLKGNHIDINAFVHTRRILDKAGVFDEQLKRLTDWDLIIRMTRSRPPVYVPRALVDYNFNLADNTISSNENHDAAYDIVREKALNRDRRIEHVHDGIPYHWEGVEEKRFINWAGMKKAHFNRIDFSAPGYPFLLQVEPTNMCNMSCPLCPVSEGTLNRPPQHMSLETFKSLVDDMEQWLLLLVLWDWGEPFMNRHLPEMIRYAADRDIRTVTSTNAHFLDDEEYVTRILRSGLTTLIVAIDSLHPEAYSAYRVGGSLERALAGLETFMALKRKLASPTRVNLRMVVMKRNEHEIRKIKKLAARLKVDWFTVKSANPDCGIEITDQEVVPDNPKLRRYAYRKGTYERIRRNIKCSRIWQMANILSNGEVVPCCYYFDGSLRAGNINEQPFTRIWDSDAYREMRRTLYNHMDEIPRCRDCTVNFKLSGKSWIVKSHRFNPGIGERISRQVSVPNILAGSSRSR